MCFGSARADEALEKLLGQRETEYVGTCRINTKQELTFDDKEATGEQQCIVGYYPKTDGDDRYVLLWVNGKTNRLVKYNLKTKKQEVIWMNPDGMV